ncbi:hypothetical protein HETIRDRAFT_328395 [Heterobasidion irregulare TC 32-1]|uniref:Uncharacterized protein n=1 Tax=Heterobasidion irregulare (strain TC 32-1) TaxID=747525 RepID=W4JTR3_HETIT|nr:uncharacterized protein HETIRDRAFT_328395 [Heterobasidion irregulare TC 32-1]ETW76495.1 hypothetical protein HETIRDRAFT_328395 [Heterobasidion irregulare TC 32-1]
MSSLNCFHSYCGLLVTVRWSYICIILFSNLSPMELIMSISFLLCMRCKGHVHLFLPMCGASLGAKRTVTMSWLVGTFVGPNSQWNRLCLCIAFVYILLSLDMVPACVLNVNRHSIGKVCCHMSCRP